MTSAQLQDRPTATAVGLHEVHKTYPGPTPVHALRGVTLTLAPGSFTAVMGPSGSGKSTLLSTAAGLDTPTSGRVLIGDQDISTLRADDLTRFRRRQVGFVFQAYNLVPHLSVAENVELPLVLAGTRPDRQWRTELLEAVGMGGTEQRRPTELSGGQAQRVAIARALFARPTVVFADEPTGALDSRTGAQVVQVLRDTADRFGQTVVVVTHDPHVAAAADSVAVLADGLLVDRLHSPTAQQVAARMLTLAGA
ncbi:ABC transporter ATP-binding protein [Nocardioides marmotae]|uniref:ATP-binding cassette domain-containing protein n=1 Tax=Nocardioides marmotae TaxID=2663857 RepID=A0A6I3JAQ7_9ACTN|nr:ABC transporter ATP-binding protein [Nocardioides marmotae]MCR6031548.1 ATP-binding cassette domain-containing protein [Gordonia jinghuaiqii]MBC9733295.1 ABC transporter ATP-binding protein [Nocardioides marmotae]MTB84404.1 ATP-binding cassette domain-containing protein [Nocardioides marmotae]MTB95187.1 ATP-binding cassette domain-containing protein [Nocardioides marmotae]QKE02329.1 ABC transporter ATP-binding protein [Nocardioides marmotae]